MKLEKMNEFFAARVNGYDEHMLNNVEGCKLGYKKMKDLIPQNTNSLLDLGCGTGLELDEIFKVFPNLQVTGIDLTQAMLNMLKQKHPNRNMHLINASYFECDLGIKKYDIAISFQTMHHFEYSSKIELYLKIFDSIKDGCQYIECDYMVDNQDEEDFYFAENNRIRTELGIPLREFYHYDTPCTIDNQIMMYLKAGFSKAEMVFREENTTIIIAYK